VLGPFEVCVHDKVLDLGGARIRTLLALLTANAGRVMSVGAVVEALWGMNAPHDAHRTVRTYVSRLRRSLEPAAAALAVDELIVTYPPGYALRLTPDLLDALRFERLVAAAREALAASQSAIAIEQFSLALALWRGDAYGEFGDTPPLRLEATRLHELRLGAIEDRIDAELATGASVTLVDELIGLTDQNPGHDRPWAQLMTALYRAGRQADALDAFGRARTVLIERFGLDPSPRLVEVHRRVLDNDARLLGDVLPVDVAAPVHRVPEPVRNDLPGDIADFAGRQAELARLLTARTSIPDAAPTAVVIEAIDGMAGVGKTTLAVHAAHRLVDHYRDAQLFIDLHGHTSSQGPITPMVALDTLLRTLGVPAEKIPHDLDARAALWRAELATRSVLVVLDNAADAAQVRPLLPGSAQSLMLITSRRRLVNLETAHILSLDVLPEADAVVLFTSIVGDDRTATEADFVRDVVEQCGHLPLAIRIAAARLRARPAWTVRYLADRLRQARRPLAELSAGDRSVGAAFALAYQHLDVAQRRMFRLLGIHPGPDLDVRAAAALAAVDLSEAERLLEGLVDDHLLQQLTAGRYRFHDLVRQHAHTTALAEEPEAGRHQALRRVIDFYLHTAYNGSRQLDQQHPPLDLDAAATGCVPHALPDDAAAMSWFDANQDCVLAARTAAEDAGWDTVVWQLAWTLDNFHYRRGHLHHNIASWLAGLAAAERLDDLAGQARAHRRLGLVYPPLGKHMEALHHLKRSLTLAEQIGDILGQAGAHFVLALAWTEQRNDHQALAHVTSARNLYRELGNSKWEVRALSMMGACHTRLGHHEQARTYCESALTLCRQHNDVYGQADSLDSLGAIANDTGQPTRALDQYQQALALWRELDNTYRQAGTLAAIGDTHSDLDHHKQARHAWQQAIDRYRAQCLHVAADRIELRRAGLDTHGVVMP
jgi:DNA-binding SARP family transcriptional activator/tetratricopeptide (TPR) repeat protein